MIIVDCGCYCYTKNFTPLIHWGSGCWLTSESAQFGLMVLIALTIVASLKAVV